VKRIRPVLLGAFAAMLLAATAGIGFVLLQGPEAEAAGEPLPLPPDLPRLDTSAEYDACLERLRRDADGALAFAEGWEAAGGGEGAKHCAALALLALGETERAAERLEQLGRGSKAVPAARAAVFAQAVQAWMLAGQSAPRQEHLHRRRGAADPADSGIVLQRLRPFPRRGFGG
jgi:hypothetical protein